MYVAIVRNNQVLSNSVDDRETYILAVDLLEEGAQEVDAVSVIDFGTV